MKRMLLLSAVFSFTLNYAQTNGTVLFSNLTVHEIRVNTPYPALFDTLEAHYNGMMGSSSYVMCSVQIDGAAIDSVGIKEKGYFSNWGMQPGQVKKPLKLDLGEYGSDERFDGVKKINLQNGFEDPSMMHDALAYRILRDAGLPAPRSSYAKVYLNNVYWGLYIVVEEPDKNFLELRFPDKNGNLYKAEQSGLEYDGTSRFDYLDNFEQKLSQNGDTSWNDLIRLHDLILNSGSLFYDSITNYFNIEYFLKSIAVDYLTDNWDNFIGHNRNFWLYHSTTDNKFHWIPWDYNLAFSAGGCDLMWDNFGQTNPLPTLWTNCRNNAVLRDQYYYLACTINNAVFTNAHLDPFIDSMKTLIRPDLNTDPNKFFTIAEFDQNITQDVTAGMFSTTYKGLKPWIQNRHDETISSLSALGYSCVAGIDENETSELLVYPNPCHDQVNLLRQQDGEARLEIINLQGQTVVTQSMTAANTMVSVAHLPAGVYLLRLQQQGKTTSVKLVKE